VAKKWRQPPKIKGQIASSAIREDRKLAELESEFGVHASPTAAWKKELKDSNQPLR
jgi:hypothetical protein